MKNLVNLLQKSVHETFSMTDQDTCRVSLVREDGHQVYPKSEPNQGPEFGVLVASAMQASVKVSSLDGRSNNELRLTCESSDSGIYVLPVQVESSSFYLIGHFEGIRNPGRIKWKLRNIHRALSNAFLIPNKKVNDDSVERKSYLFNDISDDEIDSLFAVMQD